MNNAKKLRKRVLAGCLAGLVAFGFVTDVAHTGFVAKAADNYSVTFSEMKDYQGYFGTEEDYTDVETPETVESKSFGPGNPVSLFVQPDGGEVFERINLLDADSNEVWETFTEEAISFNRPEKDLVVQVVMKEEPFDEEDSKRDDEILENLTSPDKTVDVKIEVGKSIKYYAYGTHKYTVGDSYAYCLNPSKKKPKTATYKARLITNKNILRAAYYAYGGLGYKTFKSKVGTWGNGSASNEYAMSHVMLAYEYAKATGGKASGAFRGMSDSAVSKLKKKISKMEDLPYAPEIGGKYRISKKSFDAWLDQNV